MSKCFIFKYTKNNLDKMIDNLLIKFGTFKFNLFEEYIFDFLNIISKYKSFINNKIINSIKKKEFDIKAQKELFKMQKYIYDYINKNYTNKETEQIKEYKNYLKKELNKSKLLGFDSDSFEINYLINLFSKGFNIDIDYDSIVFIHYGNNKKYCGKGIIPSSEFQLRIEPNLFKFNFFDFEFELNNLENTKMFISNIMKIFEEKLKEKKLFINPCISQIRSDIKKLDKKNIKENKKLENIISLVKDNLNKNSTFRDNVEDDDLDNLNMDDSIKLKNIKVKESNVPNHFYSETFKEKEINIMESNNSINKNKIGYIKKNNIPKINKK